VGRRGECGARMENCGRAQSIIGKYDLNIHPLAEFNKVFIQTESVGRLIRHKAYQFSIDRRWRKAGVRIGNGITVGYKALGLLAGMAAVGAKRTIQPNGEVSSVPYPDVDHSNDLGVFFAPSMKARSFGARDARFG
jgi:hypothetical protein